MVFTEEVSDITWTGNTVCFKNAVPAVQIQTHTVHSTSCTTHGTFIPATCFDQAGRSSGGTSEKNTVIITDVFN